MGVQIVTLLDHYQLCPMVFMLPVVMGTMDFESWKHRTSHSLHPQGKRETTILIFNHTSVGLHTPRARRPFFPTLTSASLHPLGEIDTYLWSSSTFLRVINLLKIQWSWNLLYIYCHDSFSFSFDCLAILSKTAWLWLGILCHALVLFFLSLPYIIMLRIEQPPPFNLREESDSINKVKHKQMVMSDIHTRIDFLWSNNSS